MNKRQLEVIEEVPKMEVEGVASNNDKSCKENEKKVKFEKSKSVEEEIGNNIRNEKYFHSELFNKPEPNYSYVHDKAIISSIDPLRKRENKEKRNSSHISSNQIMNISKKENFFEKKSYAQKLDSFIQNKT